MRKGPTFAASGLSVDYRLAPIINKGFKMKHITVHGSLCVNGRSVVVRMSDVEMSDATGRLEFS